LNIARRLPGKSFLDGWGRDGIGTETAAAVPLLVEVMLLAGAEELELDTFIVNMQFWNRDSYKFNL
jgi:hypothetical protein